VQCSGTNASGQQLFTFTISSTRWKYPFTRETTGSVPGPHQLDLAVWAVETCCQGVDQLELAPFSPVTFSSTSIGKLSGPLNTWPFIDYELCANSDVLRVPVDGNVLTWAVPVAGSVTSHGGFTVQWGHGPTIMSDGVAGATTPYPCQ